MGVRVRRDPFSDKPEVVLMGGVYRIVQRVWHGSFSALHALTSERFATRAEASAALPSIAEIPSDEEARRGLDEP